MRSIEDELAALSDDGQNLAKTVNGKLEALAGNIPKDKNSFMNAVADTAADLLNGMSTSDFNSSLGLDPASILPYDDLADLFLDSATGFEFPSISNLGLKPPRTTIRRGTIPQQGLGPGNSSYKVDYNIFQHILA